MSYFAGILGGVIGFTLYCYVLKHNKSWKNKATEDDLGVILNGNRYIRTVLTTPHRVTNVEICRTKKGTLLMEIKEYPDYAYIAAGRKWGSGADAWQFHVYRRIGKA